MRHVKRLILGSWALLALLGPSRPAPAETIVVRWDNATLQAIRDTHPGPPIVARALAIVHTCIYDAWVAYDRVAVGTRLGGALRRPPAERTPANKRKAISVAAYRALVDLFPSEVDLFGDLMGELGYDAADGSTPSRVGNAAAAAVLAFRHHDGSNQLGDLHPGAYSDYTGYVPVNTPDRINVPSRWQPLRVPDGQGGFVIQQYIAPHWGLVAPFAMSSGDRFRPRHAPPQFPDATYWAESLEILIISAGLTDRQKVIAEYWADGPSSELPPGHWCLFGQYVSNRDHHGLDDDAKMFLALANAVFDAGIAAWDAKRAYDYVRPVTSIHYLFAGVPVLAWAGPYQGTQLIDGADWQPYQPLTVVTPPFPEFISGHSTFSAAGAEVLRSFTGSDRFGNSFTQPVGTSRVEPGLTPAHDVTLSWATFSDAADEAGVSRRYGGIHFLDGDLTGRVVGRLVGAQVWREALTYFNGTARPPGH